MEIEAQESVYPESAERGSDFGSFIVYYSDGTSQLYHSSGELSSEMEATDAPGYLTYVRRTQIGIGKVTFVYTYTEEGITTEEFTLIITNNVG